MRERMSEPVSGTMTTIVAAKGGAKLFAVLAGVAGAALMVAIRPNLTRKQMALHAATAGAMSYFLTSPVIRLASGFGWLEIDKWPVEDARDIHVAVAFFIGAMSWGIVGGLYWFREKFGTNPIEAIQAIRNMRSGGISVLGTTQSAPATSLGPANGVVADPAAQGNAGKYD